jgi:Zn finger protein HypA/HybF involved in hydrogenase expression
MILKINPSVLIVVEHQKDEIFCHACSDSIVVVLKWYNCPKCNFDYCREFALERHRIEDEMV